MRSLRKPFSGSSRPTFNALRRRNTSFCLWSLPFICQWQRYRDCCNVSIALQPTYVYILNRPGMARRIEGRAKSELYDFHRTSLPTFRFLGAMVEGSLL